MAAFSLIALSSGALAARPDLNGNRDRLTTYVNARAASAVGEPRLAAELFASLFAADRNDSAIGRQTVSAGIEAGAFDLAIKAARALPAAKRQLDARLLLVADELRRGRIDAALTHLGDEDADGIFVRPLLRAWTEQEAHRDGDAVLAAQARAQTMIAPFLAEQRAYLLLAGKRSAETLITKALANASGRDVRMRLAFAEGLRRNGDRAGAAALLASQPIGLQRYASSPAPRGIAVDNAASAYAELLFALSLSVAQSEDLSLPLALAQTAHFAAPANAEGSIILALMLQRSGRDGEALALLDAVPSTDPFVADARDAAVNLLSKAGRHSEAIQHAQETLFKLGREAAADDYARLGGVFDKAGNHFAAADAFARATELADAANAGNRWSYRLQRADQLDRLGRWPEAKVELQRALAIAPDEPLILNFFGYGELDRGENSVAAEAMIRKASALAPDDASITDSLGWALYKRGRLPEAIETLRAASAGDPVQAEINEHLGDALFSSGRRIEARFAWRAALVTAEAKDKGRIEAKLERGLTPVSAAP